VKSRVTMAVALLASLAATLYGAYRWCYPYGSRPCQLPCTMMALVTYALDHNGYFPNVSNHPFTSLESLYPNYVDGDKLSGISGDRREVSRRLGEGRSLDSNVSSWVYFPGFRSDDPPALAVLVEARAGLGFDGSRAPAGSHAVGFASGEAKQIPAGAWDAFLDEQTRLRALAIARHAAVRK
jgi:hypothetical protein